MLARLGCSCCVEVHWVKLLVLLQLLAVLLQSLVPVILKVKQLDLLQVVMVVWCRHHPTP
jgi:hypothetical protein